MKGNKKNLTIPVIENIHQRVLEAVTQSEESLDMGHWHVCETTHCRAGWVEVLAGGEGKKLADKTSTAFAARQIYKASSPINVSYLQFFVSNEEAMADIKRCAEEEKLLK